jgi:hypothetical protein
MSEKMYDIKWSDSRKKKVKGNLPDDGIKVGNFFLIYLKEKVFFFFQKIFVLISLSFYTKRKLLSAKE